MESACINLKERFGTTFRITRDEACDNRADPWYYQIPGRMGTIYPYGGDTLAVEVDYHPFLFARLVRLGFTKVHQDGDHEKTLLFPADKIEEVATIVRSKRRRRLNPERRQEAIERLARFRIGKEVKP